MRGERSFVLKHLVRIGLVAVVGFFPLTLVAQLELTKKPVDAIPDGLTSRDLSVYGVTVGMQWRDARVSLEKQRLPFLLSEQLRRCDVPAVGSECCFLLDESGTIVAEIHICGPCVLPPANRFLVDGKAWRSAKARQAFFGEEGEHAQDRCSESYEFPEKGFSLRYSCRCQFQFVLLAPPAPPASPPPPSPTSCDLQETSFPFFITGWYYPNTVEQLSRLRERVRTGELINYLNFNRKDLQYELADDSAAQVVTTQFESFYNRLSQCLSVLKNNANATLSLTVTGYADTREFSSGVYVDQDVVCGNQVIKGNTPMGGDGNTKLSALRAFHTIETIKEELARRFAERFSDEVLTRVSFECIAGGVKDHPAEYRFARTVEVKGTISSPRQE
jgi:hypothetical protein